MRMFGKSSSEREVRKAAGEVVVAPPVEEPGGEGGIGEDQHGPGWWSRFKEKARRWLSVGEKKELAVKPEWARGVIVQLFEPLAKHSHPAWRVTIEEADRLTPEMQAFLQEVADRYTPAILAAIAARHPALVDVTIGLGVLFYAKSRQVAAAEKEKVEPGVHVRVPEGVAPDRHDEDTTVLLGAPPPCEKCHVQFDSVKSLAEHLPCPGPPE